MSEPLRVLLIEDSEDDALLILRELRRNQFEVVWVRVQTAQELLSALSQQTWDIIISDYRLPRFSAPAALDLVKQCHIDIPFIVVSGTIGEAVAVELMKAGAHDYLMKENLTRLPEAVRRELRDVRMRAERQQAETALYRSEAKSRAILAAIPDMMLLVGADGVYQEVITATAPPEAFFIGRSPVGLSVQDCLPPDLAAQKLRYIQQALETGQLQIYEQELPFANHVRYEEVRVVKSDHDEALLMIRDVSDRKQAEAALAKRDCYLTVLVEIQRLLLSATIDPQLYDQILALLGSVAAADRIYVFENHVDGAGNLVTSQKAEWCAPGIKPQIDNPTLQNLSFQADLPWLYEVFQRGEVINQPVSEIPAQEREHLEAQAIRSILEIPMMAHGEFFGFIGFDDCRRQRRWDPLEVDMLESVATAIALAKEREQAIQALAQLNRELEGRVTQRTVDLQDSEAKLQAILDFAPAVMFVKDLAGRYILVNREFLRLFNCTLEAVIGKTDTDLFPPNMAQVIQENDQQVLAADQVQRLEETVLIGDETYTFLSNKFLLRDHQGRPYAICGISTDISERKRAEKQLQRSEEKFRNLVENTNDIIYMLSIDGVFTYISPNWTEMLGHPVPAVLEQTFEPFVHPEDMPKWEAFLKQIVETGEQARSLEYRIQHQNGEWRWHSSNASPHWDSDGNIIAYLGIAHDITDRKLAEAQLQRTNTELARATRLKDEFLANMSHELRTPLNAILGMTEGLQENTFGAINEPQRQALETIERSGVHLLDLINDILDLSKVEAGQLELHLAPTPIPLLFQSSLTFVRQQALKKRIQLRTELPPYLPDLYVDERRICQVLINLLTNAVKFTPEGGRIILKGTVPELAGAPTPDPDLSTSFVRLAVIDTGIGIAPEDIPKLFQPFIQIDGALNRKHAGTGLGLALVKQIVELHGGQVGLTSELGVGSCFSLDLPCAPAAPLRSSTAPLPTPTLAAPCSPLPGTLPVVLLAEDNEANISTISSYLKAKGYDLRVARNGRDAIAMARAEHPDVILMDIQMPEMDGLEAIGRIRQESDLAEIPIIALTALAMAGDRDRCLAAGANQYLSKPVKLKELATQIQRLLVSA